MRLGGDIVKRVESILLIIITFLLVLVVDKHNEKDVEDLIDEFEQDVVKEEALKEYYIKGEVNYVKEENRAGRLGEIFSKGIEDGASLVIVLFDEIISDILK